MAKGVAKNAAGNHSATAEAKMVDGAGAKAAAATVVISLANAGKRAVGKTNSFIKTKNPLARFAKGFFFTHPLSLAYQSISVIGA